MHLKRATRCALLYLIEHWLREGEGISNEVTAVTDGFRTGISIDNACNHWLIDEMDILPRARVLKTSFA